MSTAAGISSIGRAELTAVLSHGRRFVTPRDVAESLGVDPGSAAKKLSHWAARGWLRRARRGLYIPVPVDVGNPAAWSEDALIVAAAVWSPCFFSGWTAANQWNLTEQVFRTTVVKTATRVRSVSVELLDHAYLLNHVSSADLDWGLKSEWRGGVKLQFADPARTVVDIFDLPRIGGGVRNAAEILSTFLDENDARALVDYGDRLGNRAVFKRIGYVAEILGKDRSGLVAACRQRVSAGISPLDPDGPKGGRRVTAWGLRVNVQIERQAPT